VPIAPIATGIIVIIMTTMVLLLVSFSLPNHRAKPFLVSHSSGHSLSHSVGVAVVVVMAVTDHQWERMCFRLQ
jgi:hypothetical protein